MKDNSTILFRKQEESCATHTGILCEARRPKWLEGSSFMKKLSMLMVIQLDYVTILKHGNIRC